MCGEEGVVAESGGRVVISRLRRVALQGFLQDTGNRLKLHVKYPPLGST